MRLGQRDHCKRSQGDDPEMTQGAASRLAEFARMLPLVLILIVNIVNLVVF